MIAVTGAAAGLAVAAPTLAADQAVTASGPIVGSDYGDSPAQFTPATVRIAPGESVTWTNGGGTHNVKFEDGQFQSPGAPAPPESWPATAPKRTFPQAGTYRFYCQMHGAAGGVGMAGVVIVGTQTDPGSGTGTPGSGTGTPGSGTGSAPTAGADAKIISLSALGRRFCTGGPNCRRPGVRLRTKLSKAAHVTGALKRRPLTGRGSARTFGTLDFGSVGGGSQALRFTRNRAGRRLTPGRYTATIRAGQGHRLVRFRVVP